ncbi:condensin-2 complex subunit G2 isoform X2 [Orussus abietinus]|uniref:condensin-2 complex subunit G2 isoform X2 n=1 Tax=Orussus abietinus TaxID=222816 RepID=UPI0006253A57|nr:condensin-2 complex subunit G2 isoform X2 [Orussus abietinus]
MSSQEESTGCKTLFNALRLENIVQSDISEKLEENLEIITTLPEEELCDLWHHIKCVIVNAQKLIRNGQTCTVQNGSDVQNSSAQTTIISLTVKIALKTIMTRTFVPQVLLDVVFILHSLVLPKLNEKQVRDDISCLLENWWKLNLDSRQKVIRNSLKYLIERAKTSLEHVKRLYDIKSAMPLLKYNEDVDALLSLSIEQNFITTKEGRTLLLCIFSLNKQWIKGIHKKVKQVLESIEFKNVDTYAELYTSAWLNACNENRKVIAEECIRNLIFHCLTAGRVSEKRIHFKNNLIKFLRYFHKHPSIKVQRMIYEQYHPILWAHLKAPGYFTRCNAADVLFAAYPIEQPNGQKKGSGANRQYEAMTALLKDGNHEVCVVAMKSYWSEVPSSFTEEWLNLSLNYTKESVYPEIRMCIFQGLKSVLSNSQSLTVLKNVLPNFIESIHDTDTNVKMAVLELLLDVRDKSEIHLYDIAPLSYILECLEIETNIITAKLIVKLLWPCVFSNNNASSMLEGIICMALKNVNAVRKFFLYSNHTIDYNTSLRLIEEILREIKGSVQEFSMTKEPMHKSIKVNGGNGLRKISHSEGRGKRTSKLAHLKDPLVIQALFDVGAILWTISSEEFTKENHKDEVENLRLIVANELPHFFNLFKGTPICESVLFLFTLLPESMISSDSTIFSDICVQELNDPDVSDDTILTIVYLLVKWNKVNTILLLLKKLLTAATDHEQRTSSRKRLKLQTSMVKRNTMELGLRILDHLLYDEFQSVLMNDHHESMIKFHQSLSFVKSLVERKLGSNSSRDPVYVEFMDSISEEVLGNLFNQYVSLICILNKAEVFNASEHLTDVALWAQTKIVPRIPKLHEETSSRFSINLLKIIFNIGNRMMLRLHATPKLCCELVLLYSKCLVTQSGIVFVNEVLITLKTLTSFEESVYMDEASIVLGMIIPRLLAAVMITLTKHTWEDTINYANNLKTLPALIPKLFAVLECSPDQYSLRMTYMTILFNTSVVGISKEIIKVLQRNNVGRVNILNTTFPCISEKILRVILRGEKLRKLSINVLNKAIRQYAPIDVLSALLIVYRIVKVTTKASLRSLKNVMSTAESRKLDMPSYTCIPRIDDIKQEIIGAIASHM